MVYEWRKGSRVTMNPQIVGEELDRLQEEFGMLHTAKIVESAKSGDSPLHGHFEWDDSIASHEYRKHQARMLVSSIRIISEDESNDTPVYVNVRDSGENYYQKTTIVVGNPDLWLQVMTECRTSLGSWEQRLRSLLAVEQSSERIKGTQEVIGQLQEAQQSLESVEA